MVSFGDVVVIRSVGLRRVNEKRKTLIFDGMWKWELKKQSIAIWFWQRLPMFYQYTEHQLNKAVLYSAIVIRKIIEDSLEVNAMVKKHKWVLDKDDILEAKIHAIEFPFVGDEEWYVRGKIFASEYDSGKNVDLNSKEICNWIVHSYCWSIVKSFDDRKYSGFLVASDFDKVKCIHFVSFKDWINFLELVIREASV